MRNVWVKQSSYTPKCPPLASEKQKLKTFSKCSLLFLCPPIFTHLNLISVHRRIRHLREHGVIADWAAFQLASVKTMDPSMATGARTSLAKTVINISESSIAPSSISRCAASITFTRRMHKATESFRMRAAPRRSQTNASMGHRGPPR